MSDFEINKAVSGKFRKVWTWKDKVYLSISSTTPFDPCNNPSDAWSIIVENKITISPQDNGFEWEASHGLDENLNSKFEEWDKNPLRAAMICFLKMKENEEKQNEN